MYDHKKIEQKWQKDWEEKNLYKTGEDKSKEKYYVLDMFPYPSGAGLHVGHPKGYIATDILARMKMMQGYNVLHPMGWDAFGLPAENFAIKNKTHPRKMNEKNIATFKNQLKKIGFTYDWGREINTTDPKFYKWTQWTFLQMFKKGLAYESHEPINWCPNCQTGLANEDLEGGKCERCGSEIEQKPMRQWVLKITDYADRLLKDLDKLPDWEDSIKEMQRNWIGKSVGSKIIFKVVANNNDGRIDNVNIKESQHFSQNNAESTQNNAEKNKVGDFLFEDLTYKIRGAMFNVRKKIGLGHKESVYHKALEIEFEKQGLSFESEKRIDIKYEDEKIGVYQPDFVVENKVLIELKALPKIGKQQLNQVWTYLKGSDYKLALLVNFSSSDLEIKRMVYDSARNQINSAFSALSQRGSATSLEVFTTRPDTLFGCTFMVIAPEHPLIENLKDKIENYDEIKKYQEQAKKKTEMERTELNKEKTGVRVKGIMAINPVIAKTLSQSQTDADYTQNYAEENFLHGSASSQRSSATSAEVPIFVADYVMMGYGTGAIMAVPAHDERDYAFASQKNAERTQNDAEIKIRPVVLKKDNKARSVLMGTKNITENDLKNIGVEIVEKKKDRYHIFIPFDKIEEYKKLIREKMENHFWNEFYTGENFYFIFKHKDGKIEEFELNSDTNDQIDIYGMTFNDEKPKEKPENVYNWLAENDFYKELFLSAEEGIAINSDFLNGLPTKKAKEKMIEWLEEKGLGKRATNYKLKDWVFSRQRYWGEPIPVVHCEKCGVVAVPEKDLPVTLPEVESYEPTGTGESPLANIDEWVNTTCPKCKGPAKRETNTMPQWAGSSWYYLRYIDPHNDKALVDKEKEKYWSPVDFYVGGAEHATRHLIYARFWHKFLYDIGVVNYEEPFTKLRHVGLIMAEDGRKMSKRWGNVINPDDIVEEYGADAMRVYEMFMGPFSQSCAWSTNGLIGARKFIEKIVALFEKVSDEKSDEEIQRELHKTIKKVSQDIDEFKFNTAIAQMMILVNKMTSAKKINKEDYKLFLQILGPFAPHISEELWQKVGEEKSIFLSAWPKYDESLVKEEKVLIVVQVNGKVRAKLEVNADINEEELKKIAFANENVKKWLEGKEIKKIIFIKGKILSIVV